MYSTCKDLNSVIKGESLLNHRLTYGISGSTATKENVLRKESPVSDLKLWRFSALSLILAHLNTLKKTIRKPLNFLTDKYFYKKYFNHGFPSPKSSPDLPPPHLRVGHTPNSRWPTLYFQ